MMNAENSGKTYVVRAAPIRETSVRRREMIDQMEPSFIGKQIGFLTDRGPEEFAWPCVDRKSVSPDENLVNLSTFGRIALAPAEPSREQVCDRSQDPTEHHARTAPLDREFAPDAKSNSVTDWVGEINRLWAKGNAATLELARIVSAARNGLRRGGWSALWRSDRMLSKLPFAKRKGEMLVSIGDGLGWANAHHCAHLPNGLKTLYHLSRLDRRTLERLIGQGVIHPALKESEARELAARFRGKSIEARTRKANVRARLRRFAEFVHNTVSDWEPDERESATETLTQLIEQIGTAGSIVLMRKGTA